MKILIAYSTKNGSTEKCAQLLHEYLQDSVLCDLSKEAPDIAPYDAVIVGGCIRMGKLYAPTAKFIQANHDALLAKKAGYFVCCGYMDMDLKYFANNIAMDLLKASVNYRCFGGRLDITELHGMDLFIGNMVAKKTPSGTPPPRIREKEIARMAKDFDPSVEIPA